MNACFREREPAPEAALLSELVRSERLTGTSLTPASTRDPWRAKTTPVRVVSAVTATLRGS